MSSEVHVSRLPLSAQPVEAVRPCAFYMTQMQSAVRPKEKAVPTENHSALHHRCLLNPGRTDGPDGEAVGFEQCSVERQTQCQLHRRARLSSLNKTCSAHPIV